MRTAILVSALVFIVILAGLLVASVAESGVFSILEVVSVLILAMAVFGVLGALRNPED